jgi:hypothetical protein
MRSCVTVAGMTEPQSSTGAQANDYSDSATISADGRFCRLESSN